MTLNKHFTPVFEIIEKVRLYLAIKHKRNIFEKDLAKELNMCHKTMAKYKHDNSNLFLANLAEFCIKENIDIRDFCSFNNSITLEVK